METDDPLLLEALREVDRIAPAAPDVAPPLVVAAQQAVLREGRAHEELRRDLTAILGPVAALPPRDPPPCEATGADAPDCPHCMEQRGRHIDAMIARSRGWQ